MRYMRWSYRDLMTMPDGYMDIIVEVNKQEAKDAKARAAKRSGGKRGRR